ncbi:hypothetical protein C2S51_010430 [Perilla frutescens var. frutescens]|nr:hypothetical protein C2S51_010430 [Perilla frutescens var. frutescens]
MAAYSAVACFRQTLEQLLDSGEFPELEIQSVYGNVVSLQSSLEGIPFVPKHRRGDMKELQNGIRDAIYAAQDKVEYLIKGHSSEKSDEKASFKKIADDVAVVAKKAKETAEAIKKDPDAQNLFSENIPKPPRSSFSGKYKIVGQEEDFKKVTEQLLSEEKQRLVIPITGLPGLGKTTLARSIYENQRITSQFSIRAWVTVSQDFNFQEIFSSILSSMESKNYRAGHYAKQGDERTLLNYLHQELYNSKYLIVLDDVWEARVWDRVAVAFPDKENGSRVLITSRIPAVAATIQPTSEFIHEMRPLGPDDSWELLCEKAFDDEPCPPHLKDIGRSIAEKCKGLPLSLTVVGGLLSQKRGDLEYWKGIEEDVGNAASEGDSSYEEILSLSYNHLPGKLKGCFLYMGAFPEDCEIRVSKLIKLWVAEGFLPLPPQDLNVEFVAWRCLEDLIGRNLISIRKKSSNGGMKVCSLHDSLRELAERESRKEKFFHSRKEYNQVLEQDAKIQRRVSIHKSILLCLEDVYNSTQSIKDARSLLYVGPYHHHPLSFCLTFDLLRVLDAFTVYFIDFPHEFLKLIHLRYLSFTYNDDISPNISQLQKLQVLMVRREPKIIFVGVSFLPDEIWDMPELRHLWFTETDFPPLLPKISENRVLLLNLQTLANVNAAFFTDEVLDNMPNLRKLSMWIEAPDKIGFSLKKLSKLESFKFVVLNPILGKGIEVEAEHFFPKTLRRLNLSGCGLPWNYMRFLANELKNLEVLKLRELAFHGQTWHLDYSLEKLKYLLIEYLNIKTWEASVANFPSLERLILRHCYELEEIPPDMTYIGPLELIELVDCSPDAVASAEEIRDQMEEYDRTDLQVRIFSSWQRGNITTCNFSSL